MKYAKWIFATIYIVIILFHTVIGRTVFEEPIFKGLFWEIQNEMWNDIFLNILLFLPLGFIIGGWKGLVIGFCLSCCIEAFQYFRCVGYCELDDVLNNTIGSSLGVVINFMIKKTVIEKSLRKWNEIPEFMRTAEVKPYWDILNNKKEQLFIKRVFDVIFGVILLVVLLLPMALIALLIKIDSEGPVFYRQERVTKYGKHFRIHKFRTMVSNADKIGSTVTVGNDARITRIGSKLRGLRLDELPQVLDVINGNMSFVGTRPEAVKYVDKYKSEYNATLLMPAGITSEASIRYKDEARLLDAADDTDNVYVEAVLPGKMKCNLQSIRSFSLFNDIATMLRTVFAVLGKEYK